MKIILNDCEMINMHSASPRVFWRDHKWSKMTHNLGELQHDHNPTNK